MKRFASISDVVSRGSALTKSFSVARMKLSTKASKSSDSDSDKRGSAGGTSPLLLAGLPSIDFDISREQAFLLKEVDAQFAQLHSIHEKGVEETLVLASEELARANRVRHVVLLYCVLSSF